MGRRTVPLLDPQHVRKIGAEDVIRRNAVLLEAAEYADEAGRGAA